MADLIHSLLPAAEELPSDRQRSVVLFLSSVLISLVLLNLFDEFSDRVHVASFSWSLLAAVLLQVFVKGTNAALRNISVFFSVRPGILMMALRFFTSWLVLFLSKFVILEAIVLVFGDKVRFEGAMYGLVTLAVVVTVMVIAEEAVLRFIRWIR